MRPTRKNHTNFYNGVNAVFGEAAKSAVKNIFTGEYHGTKCTLSLIINTQSAASVILFCVEYDIAEFVDLV